MPYERIEPSKPEYAPPGLHFLTFMSPALGGRGNVLLFIPPGHEQTPNLPMVLLLHGVYGSHWSWCFMGGAHVAAQQLIDSAAIRPMAIVMPSDGLVGEGSGYAPHPGRDCERWVVEDVPGCVRETYECFSERSPMFICGFSMGGLGALRLGAKYSTRFRGISGHASANHYDQLSLFFGAKTPVPDYLKEEDKSALLWIKRNRNTLPPLRFDCGADDLLVQYNRQLHEALDTERIPHRYEEAPGRHGWDYCHNLLKDSLRFFDSILKEEES